MTPEEFKKKYKIRRSRIVCLGINNKKVNYEMILIWRL